MKKNKLFQMYRYKNYDKKINFLILLIIFCFVFEVITIPFFTKQVLDIEIPNKNIRGSYFIWYIICNYKYPILLFCFKILYCKTKFRISNNRRIKEGYFP